MSPYVFVLTWILHSTVLGVCVLLLPRVCRASDPRQLTWWWGSSIAGVVVAPLLPLLLPARAVAPPHLTALVESATVAIASGAVAASVPSPWGVLGGVWALGALVRVAWLMAGHRRLSRRLTVASQVVDEPALERARELLPARSAQFPLVSVPVDVLETTSASPCAIGWRRVRVLVPEALRAQPDAQRVSVYLHELLHVARGDVHRAWGDEAVRVLCWWQPAVWWLLARLRLAREHEVDREVVARTGGTRAYVEALVWCSTLRPVLSVGPHAGSSRHTLVRRVRVICQKGDVMSRTRRWTTNAGMTVMAAAITTTLGLVAPLRATGPGFQVRDDHVSAPGPLERVAVLPSLDVPAPRRVVSVDPEWNDDGTAYRFRVHLVVDAVGRVAEARLVGFGGFALTQGGPTPRIAEAREAVIAAVRQWQFESPLQAPMLIATDVTVGTPAAGARVTSDRPPLHVGGAIRPPVKLVDVPPVYPPTAKDAGVSGVVVVDATIDTEGHVHDVRVLRSIPLLDEAAIDAVRQWRYSPTYLNGEAVPITMTMTINFTLQ